MPTISLRDGATIKVEVSGSGTPIVLISGLGGTSRFWAPLIKELGPSFHTISFDQRGIGASERGSAAVDIQCLAEDTWEIIDALGIKDPILCGHSTGGAIVQEMALNRPQDPSGIILSGSWVGPDPFVTNMFNIRLEILKKQPHLYAGLAALLGSTPRWHRANAEALQQAMASVPSGMEIRIIRERIEALLAHDCRNEISNLKPRTLVLGSEDDVIIPVYLQEELASLANNATLHTFDKGGHFFPISRPGDAATVIRQWLATGN